MIDEATLVGNSLEHDYDYVPMFEREARVSISLHSTIFVSNFQIVILECVAI